VEAVKRDPDDPELSVVVPVYNERAVLPQLRERLFTVLEASCPDYEVVFVDDGSMDESAAILLDAARDELDRVGRSVLHLQGILLVLSMIGEPGYLVDFLPERAAEGDVHFLEAAADAEHRHAACHGQRDERQRQGIAM